MELSVQEEILARPLLSTNEIPYPKLLIKDPNTINNKGEFPTRLVIPAPTFTATLSNTRYLDIKEILDKEEVNNSCNSIFQALKKNEILKELELKRDKTTITSVDSFNMQPSIKLSTIKKAVRFFARKLIVSTKKTINL